MAAREVKRLNTRTRLRGGSSSITLGEAKGLIFLVDLERRILPDPPRPVESSREGWKPQRLHPWGLS